MKSNEFISEEMLTAQTYLLWWLDLREKYVGKTDLAADVKKDILAKLPKFILDLEADIYKEYNREPINYFDVQKCESAMKDAKNFLKSAKSNNFDKILKKV